MYVRGFALPARIKAKDPSRVLRKERDNHYLFRDCTMLYCVVVLFHLLRFTRRVGRDCTSPEFLILHEVNAIVVLHRLG